MAHIFFEQRAIEDVDATRKVGRPQFKNVDVAVITADRNTRVEKFLDDEATLAKVKEMYPMEYQSFKNGSDELELTGMPLTEWAAMDAARIKMCNLADIYTVEQLAGANEGDLDNIGAGARDLKSKAQAWLDQSNDVISADEIAELRKDNETLKNELAAMLKTVQELTAKAKAKNKAKKK